MGEGQEEGSRRQEPDLVGEVERDRQERTAESAQSEQPTETTNEKSWPLARKFLLLALVVMGLFFFSGMNCTDSTYDIADGKTCSEEQGQKAGITLIIGVIGYFVLRAVESSGGGGRRRENEVAPVPTAAVDPALASLEKLHELHEKGVLTDEEFARKKTQLLDSS